MVPVEPINQFKLRLLSVVSDQFGWAQVFDRRPLRLKRNALIDGRHEAGTPGTFAINDLAVVILDHDEPGKVLVLAAKPVCDP